ncbi:MAG: hypothetical protein JWO43_649 [Candidatus Adlerbacteria bacterium]|nr:hypothetical protein [Candidatus Adlerbacteria bacterium]
MEPGWEGVGEREFLVEEGWENRGFPSAHAPGTNKKTPLGGLF